MRWLLVTTLGACSFSGGAPVAIDAAPGIDTTILVDAPPPIDAPPGVTCYGSSWWQVCPTSPIPSGMLMVGATIDTDGVGCAVLAGPNATTVCAIASESIKVAGLTAVTGSRPLVLLATTGVLQIAGGGTIDVASHRNGLRGAGSDDPACTAGTAAATAGAAGYGGSFGGKGGDGGSSTVVVGGTAGPAATAIAAIRGGCAGSTGLPNTADNSGHGGGGVVLISTSEAKIDGKINASGSGANGGNAVNGGGGGGGSGGLIVIDAPLFSGGGGARIFANGGGGSEGEGNDGTNDKAGNFGDDPTENLMQAQGGSQSTATAGNGGNGGYGLALAGANGGFGLAVAALLAGGGGGGGGSVGMFVVHATTKTFGGLASPPAQ